MAKRKQEAQPLAIPVPPDGSTFTVNGTSVEAATVGRWGYGFERHGAKWRAYKTGLTLEYLTPERGEELHGAVARIQRALAGEIAHATRTRRTA